MVHVLAAAPVCLCTPAPLRGTGVQSLAGVILSGSAAPGQALCRVPLQAVYLPQVSLYWPL